MSSDKGRDPPGNEPEHMAQHRSRLMLEFAPNAMIMAGPRPHVRPKAGRPPKFEKDVLASKRPTVQIDVDATALTQAGVGASYLQNIVEREASGYLQHREGTTISPIDLVMRTAFTPNHNSEWFLAIMADINNITMLTHRSYGGGADSRTRTRNRRAPAGDAGQAGRNHDRENLGQRSCD
jgi:hypothetical protein